MNNLYTSSVGKKLKKLTDRAPTKIWSIVRCTNSACRKKFDIRYVKYVSGYTVCPHCNNLA